MWEVVERFVILFLSACAWKHTLDTIPRFGLIRIVLSIISQTKQKSLSISSSLKAVSPYNILLHTYLDAVYRSTPDTVHTVVTCTFSPFPKIISDAPCRLLSPPRAVLVREQSTPHTPREGRRVLLWLSSFFRVIHHYKNKPSSTDSLSYYSPSWSLSTTH